nr:2-dehydropantoate 2-reductase N-terminal domain-containing protein [Segatella maculosa]
MKILILGLGVIGSTYGYILRKSGHDVAHYIRPTSQNHATESLSVSLLDGRNDKKGLQTEDHYPITRATPGSRYDFIIVSLSSLRLEEALETLRDNRFEGTILLFCGVWESREHIEHIMPEGLSVGLSRCRRTTEQGRLPTGMRGFRPHYA